MDDEIEDAVADADGEIEQAFEDYEIGEYVGVAPEIGRITSTASLNA